MEIETAEHSVCIDHLFVQRSVSRLSETLSLFLHCRSLFRASQSLASNFSSHNSAPLRSAIYFSTLLCFVTWHSAFWCSIFDCSATHRSTIRCSISHCSATSCSAFCCSIASYSGSRFSAACVSKFHLSYILRGSILELLFCSPVSSSEPGSWSSLSDSYCLSSSTCANLASISSTSFFSARRAGRCFFSNSNSCFRILEETQFNTLQNYLVHFINRAWNYGSNVVWLVK